MSGIIKAYIKRGAVVAGFALLLRVSRRYWDHSLTAHSGLLDN